jgi:hypothetical protein
MPKTTLPNPKYFSKLPPTEKYVLLVGLGNTYQNLLRKKDEKGKDLLMSDREIRREVARMQSLLKNILSQTQKDSEDPLVKNVANDIAALMKEYETIGSLV